ncbi:C2H2-like zinc finger protein [Quillaja saponaria]|uniref:C2H2-like zinc finger protein n=1 Tax=Quillaja saponaria TaxID=32244 RepID=A0AAD7PMM9_QUISA|nr:C2H2-like zinc finger protein [Quillaja saponaria]
MLGWSKWVIFYIICLSLSLQQLRKASSASPPIQTDQVHEDFLSGRYLKQEQGGSHEIHCSRERSRAAWKIIEEYLVPFVEKEQYQLSRRCRLHPDNDLFRDQEHHKVHLDINEWQCGFCKKSFYEEKHLDKHFDNRHGNLLNSHSRCLADVCGALHCDHVMNSVSQKSKCNPAAASRNKHLCESLADNCFPVNEGPSASRLHEFFLHQFCDAHSCTGRQKPFSRGRRKKTSIFYIFISFLTLILLLLFYVYIYLYQRGMKRGTLELKRISQSGRKKKPF